MIGCSFVVDREYFGEIGLLDPGMEVYGGENIELGMRVSKKGDILCNVCLQRKTGACGPAKVLPSWLEGHCAEVIDTAMLSGTDSPSKWMFLVLLALRQLKTVRNMVPWFILSVYEPDETNSPPFPVALFVCRAVLTVCVCSLRLDDVVCMWSSRWSTDGKLRPGWEMFYIIHMIIAVVF